ncbi:MAG: DNA/RNA helicase domain-containing protein, partial [Isosphaeraceae bacterium]
DGAAVSGVAYLHNATERGVAQLRRPAQTQDALLFTGERRSEFIDFLRARLAVGAEGAPYADMLLSSHVAPSRQLLTVAAAEIREREQFVLVDEQRLAFNLVLHATESARAGDAKTVVIVTGGPGSGKSVIALSLLGELARRGRTVVHATGSRSFTQTLRKVVGRGSRRTQSLFKYFNQFIDAERNGLDVLILDEAHRIRETSADRYTPARLRSGRPQLDELIAAARVPVFLLDENQVVRPGELGTVADIEAHASGMGLAVQKIPLDGHFRCGGSEAYLDWVNRLLGLTPGGPLPWCRDPVFEVRVAETPYDLEQQLRVQFEAGYGARMAAGFCWPWSDPRKDGSLVPDVVIGDWSRPWNIKGDRAVGGAPPAALWASDPAGFAQVGCVYTAQGFEYDWNGVIIGPDLVWRLGRWVAVRAANKDPDFRNRTGVNDHEFDRLVRNVYKVLLTRGMSGTVIYSADSRTRTFLRSLID